MKPITYREADLAGDETDLAIARLLMEWGQEEGAIPRERAAVTEGEEAIFALADTPAGAETIIGGIVFFQPEDHDMLFVDILYVAKHLRRRGIAAELLRRVAGEAEARGIARLEFGTLVTNDAMQALGHRAGFQLRAVFMSRQLIAEKVQ